MELVTEDIENLKSRSIGEPNKHGQIKQSETEYYLNANCKINNFKNEN